MTIRKMTPAEIDAHGTHGIPRGEVDAAFTDDAGGLALLWRDHIGPVESGKLPNFQVFEFLCLRIVVDGLTTSVGPHDQELRAGVATLLERLRATNEGLREISVEYALTTDANRLVVESHQVVRGRKRDARFGISSELMAEILPAVCGLMFDSVRRERARVRQTIVDKQVQQVLGQVASHLWQQASESINFGARIKALRAEREAAFDTARQALLTSVRDELSWVSDPEVLDAIIAGLPDLKRPSTLAFTHD